MDKVLIAMDSFKGSLTAAEACAAVSRAVAERYPECVVDEMPLSDGGEGLTEVLVNRLGGRRHKVVVVDPLMREIEVELGAVDGCAVIEVASAAGLMLLGEKERNPMKTTTCGVGMMIRAAMDLGYKRMLIGLGGSATTDAGFGALQVLGLRCFNSQGRLIREPITGSNLADIAHIDTLALRRSLSGVDIRVVCDVQNPFCGHNGAAVVFSPQKGASADDVAVLDAGLRSLSHVIKRTTSVSVENMRGAGAAGGFGGSLAALTGAVMVSGAEEVMGMLHFGERMEGVDLVVTGEGCIDGQSLMGKVVGCVVSRVRRERIPVLALGGRVESRAGLMSHGALNVLEVSDRKADLKSQMQREVAADNLYRTMAEWLKFDKLK